MSKSGPSKSPVSTAKAKAAEGKTAPSSKAENPPIPPELAQQILRLRSSVRENFGKATMAMMMLPRYRNQTIGDLQHLVLEPLLRDRLALAFPAAKDGESEAEREMLGFAIWASVSEEVDAKLREQVKAGSFPVRLKAEDWNSGTINWLLDVIAPSREATTSVIANFRQVAKEGSLVLHPVITRLIDPEILQKMGAVKSSEAEAQAQQAQQSLPEGETIN